jgi:FKBP-type peptidyl-prolyl cis-trans isomerase
MQRIQALGAVALAAFASIATVSAQDSAPTIALNPPKTYTSEEVFTSYGWVIAKQLGVVELGFSEAEVDSLAAGLKLALAGKEAPVPQAELQAEVSKLLEPRVAAYRAKEQEKQAEVAKVGRAEQDKYFAELDAGGKATKTASGLRYEVVAAGEGDKPTASSTVKVHYTGRLLNGTVFDSSVERGEPAQFRLDQVIPGWTEGLQLVGKGGKLKLHIPSDLAYGDAGRPSIPPASALVFDVELLEIENEVATAPAAAPAP